jgi:hypothetical protein
MEPHLAHINNLGEGVVTLGGSAAGKVNEKLPRAGEGTLIGGRVGFGRPAEDGYGGG